MLFATADGGTGLPRAVLRLVSRISSGVVVDSRGLTIQPVLFGICFALATELGCVDWAWCYGIDSTKF